MTTRELASYQRSLERRILGVLLGFLALMGLALVAVPLWILPISPP